MSAHLSDLDRELHIRLLRKQIETRAEHRKRRRASLHRLELAILWFICGATALWLVVSGV